MKFLKHGFLTALALLWGWGPSLSDSGPKPAAPARTRVDAFIGERAVYTVKWDPPWYWFFLPQMEVAETEILLTGIDAFKNRPALKTVVSIRSSGTLKKLTGFVVEDLFEIYAEPETLHFTGAFIRIHEGKKRRRREIEYLPASRRLHYLEINEAVSPPALKKEIARDDVPPVIHDPISALYVYRSEKLEPDLHRTYLIVNNDKTKESSARVNKLESLKTPAGNFRAWRMETDVLQGNLFQEKGQLIIWLSADERQIPVQFEAKIGMGRMLGKLKSVTPLPTKAETQPSAQALGREAQGPMH